MDPFYSWKSYIRLLKHWIEYFVSKEPLDWPITRDDLMENRYWRSVVLAAAEFEMLEFYGCLDAKL